MLMTAALQIRIDDHTVKKKRESERKRKRGGERMIKRKGKKRNRDGVREREIDR